MNPQSLALLGEKGVLLGATIRITNAFYAENELMADSLEISLIGYGFRTIERTLSCSSKNLGKFYIEANINIVLTLSSLDDMTDLCVDIAQHCGAEYDGWFTEVQPPDAK
jgi:hypothetical protein